MIIRLPVEPESSIAPAPSGEVLLLRVLLRITRVPGGKPSRGVVLIDPLKRIPPTSPKPAVLEALLEMVVFSMVNKPPPDIEMAPPKLPAELPEMVLLRIFR